MGEACSTHGRDGKCKASVTMSEGEQGRLILEWILIHLEQDRDHWQAVVNTLMNLWVPKNMWNFLAS
jgi:hypothetical protein